MSEPTPYWLLIAVLQSTVPLAPPLAMRLYHAALGLEREREDIERLSGDLAMGEVRRLGRTLLLGSISGPGFEAALDTPMGSGTVRFVLTREGLRRQGIVGDADADSDEERRDGDGDGQGDGDRGTTPRGSRPMLN